MAQWKKNYESEIKASFSFLLVDPRLMTRFPEDIGGPKTGILVDGRKISVTNGSVIIDDKGMIVNFKSVTGGAFFFNPYDPKLVKDFEITSLDLSKIKLPR